MAKSTISLSSGLTLEEYIELKFPFSSIKYLKKFHLGDLSFHPLLSIDESHLYTSFEFFQVFN